MLTVVEIAVARQWCADCRALRKAALPEPCHCQDTMPRALDSIEALRAENERLRVALRRIRRYVHPRGIPGRCMWACEGMKKIAEKSLAAGKGEGDA